MERAVQLAAAGAHLADGSDGLHHAANGHLPQQYARAYHQICPDLYAYGSQRHNDSVCRLRPGQSIQHRRPLNQRIQFLVDQPLLPGDFDIGKALGDVFVHIVNRQPVHPRQNLHRALQLAAEPAIRQPRGAEIQRKQAEKYRQCPGRTEKHRQRVGLRRLYRQQQIQRQIDGQTNRKNRAHQRRQRMLQPRQAAAKCTQYMMDALSLLRNGRVLRTGKGNMHALLPQLQFQRVVQRLSSQLRRVLQRRADQPQDRINHR